VAIGVNLDVHNYLHCHLSHLYLVEDECPAPESAHDHAHGHSLAVREPAHPNCHGGNQSNALNISPTEFSHDACSRIYRSCTGVKASFFSGVEVGIKGGIAQTPF
jgi:hypothetical protein